MKGLKFRRTLFGMFVLLCFGVGSVPASAAELPPYSLNAELSLTGDCSTSALDPVPDPGCPYPPPPGGPSGRFAEPRSVAFDSFGNEYVASYDNRGEGGRIDVFDDGGHFITEVKSPNAGPQSLAVDSQGNLYVYNRGTGTSGDISRYTPTVYDGKAGKIEYGNAPVVIGTNSTPAGLGLAIDSSNDRLYVVLPGAIAEYSSAAEDNKVLSTITHEKLLWNTWVAVDAERRRVYASFCANSFTECGVLVFSADAPHTLLKELDGSNTPAAAGRFESTKGWLSIAVDEESGHFFVDDLEASKNIYEFDENYEFVSKLTLNAFQGGNRLQIAVSNSPLDEAAENHRFLFVPVLPSGNRVLAFEPRAGGAPEVLEASAVNIGETEADLQARIDPNQFETDYVFEFVTQQSFEEEGFAGAIRGGEGTIPGADLPTPVSANITGLSPGTTYRFRVLAENEKGQAEPVTEGVFATYADAPIAPEVCPNDAVRIGPSALLPDCRAYELVTPPDTNGRPVRGTGFEGDRFPALQVSPLGNAVSFMLEGGVLPGTEGVGGLDGDPYKATRSPSGWSTQAAGPSGEEASVVQPGSVSPDQGHSFWLGRGAGSAVIEGGETRYIRYPTGQSALIGRGSLGTDPRAKGELITENATHIVFQTENFGGNDAQQLEPNAPPTGTHTVYDRTSDEVTHVVSLLPGNVTPAADEDADYLGASADGDGIAFSIGSTLYLRKDNAVTYEVGEGVTFAGVSEGGERVYYVKGGDVYAFDTATEGAVRFTEVGNATVVNVAPDGTRVYFVTTKAIPGGGQNPNGAFAKAGQQNLYLSEEGAITFVGTVTTRDVEGEVDGPTGFRLDGLGLWTQAMEQPVKDPSRLTPDGTVLLFQSRANLDGYDPGGFPQVYRYDSVADRLDCISCVPTLVSADGGATLVSSSLIQSARTEAPSSLNGFVPNVTPDGKRAFFESKEALVSTDVNGVQDVYEWEENQVGSCKREGGCVYLISSGRSARDNYLFGHSRSGDDVFFTTNDVLTESDLGATTSVYDARVGGGFPEQDKDVCVGEGCRPNMPPPPAIAPPGQPGTGEDNVTPKKPRTCPKGKRKVKRNGKVRCVKKHRKQKRNKSGQNRRAGR
jgi:hypothetical protein